MFKCFGILFWFIKVFGWFFVWVGFLLWIFCLSFFPEDIIISKTLAVVFGDGPGVCRIPGWDVGRRGK